MQLTKRRDPFDIRIDFKTLTAQRFRGSTPLAQFERLWDEVNQAAMV
ncbi:MAG: hypothetical protein M3O74_11420 [Pseudomonadota bacterium]|nr:hypothetical protein [Pseudomonadota bacterium]